MKALSITEDHSRAIELQPISLLEADFPTAPLQGWTRFTEIDRPFRFDYACTAEWLLTPDDPALYFIERDHVSMYVHNQVPAYLRGVIFSHEAFEAALVLAGADRRIAHRVARAFEQEYAKDCLNEHEYQDYVRWRNGLKDESRPVEHLLRENQSVELDR